MSNQDLSRLEDFAAVGAQLIGVDSPHWKCDWTLEKRILPESLQNKLDAYSAANPDGQYPAELMQEVYAVEPYETIDRHENLLMYGGASNLWQCLIGNGVTTSGSPLTYFNNANAALGVGDSSTAAAATQTNLQAATNKLRKAMDATYPQHTDAVTSGAASIVFKSTFGSADANFAWNEWATFNSATDAVGRMLNRKAEGLGTKASGSTWTLTVTLTLA